MTMGLISLEGPANDMIRRQVLRGIRRALLGLMVQDAAQYGVSLTTVAEGLASGQMSPTLRRQFDEFMRTVGLPRANVIALGGQVRSGDREDWEIEDIQVLVNGYANHGKITVNQMNEVAALTKRVVMTLKRTTARQPEMDVLTRRARGIPDDEQP